jgi:hypothetical protein
MGVMVGLAACASLVLFMPTRGESGPWVRAGVNTAKPVWGLRDGIQFGIWPGAIEGDWDGGPRGLIRVGYPVGDPPVARLVNFIAVEPDVGDGNWRGLSEMEWSDLDGVQGRRFTAEMPPGSEETVAHGALPPGQLDHPDDNPQAERLRLLIRVERFANGAHVSLLASVRDDRPEELMLEVFAEADSVPIRQCVLTATMGNYARLRRVTLAEGNELLAPLLWRDFGGTEFAPFHETPCPELARLRDGSVLVPMECDEEDPAGNWPYDPAIPWRWGWEKLTQYWRKPASTVGGDLTFAANARAVYWAGTLPIPGGIAFENTELRQAYTPGDPFVFGITRRTQAELLGE